MTVDGLPGGGSRVHVVNHRQLKGKGYIAVVFMTFFGKKMLTKHLQDTLEILRHQAPAGG